DVGEIRRLLEALRDAKGKRAYAEQDLGRKQTTESEQERASAEAEARLADARQVAADALAAWAGRWTDPIVTPVDARALVRALEQAGEPGATNIIEVFDGRTAERKDATITARANLEMELREVRTRLAGQRGERDAIAAEQDDAPPTNDLRPANRTGRPG